MPTYLLGTAFVFALLAITLAALQILTIIPTSGLPMTLSIIAAALLSIRALITHRKATNQ